MKTGIELIALERQEQIDKHNYTIYDDVDDNDEGQLADAAAKLCADDIGGYWPTKSLPSGWSQEVWDKMTNKPYKERLIIAGALIAAEIDRLNHH
jgi:hypothetical protein